MVTCSACGIDIAEASDFCPDCGSELSSTDDPAEESFLDRYGAEPLPLANERGEMISLYANLLGNIPVVGGMMKFFSGFGFWCYSIWLKIFSVITMGADVTKRFEADFNYLKDNFYSGYEGSQMPPEPPEQ